MNHEADLRQALLPRLALLRPYRWRLAVSYLLLLITAGFQLAYPSAIALFIDQMIAGAGWSWLALMAAIMLVIIGVHAVANALRHYLFASTGSQIVAGLRNRFFMTMLRQNIAFFERENVGELTNRLTTDIDLLQETLTTELASLLQTALIALGGAVMLISISPVLSLLMLVLVPVVIWTMRKVGGQSRQLANMRQERLAYCSRLAQEMFANIRLVQAFTQERQATKRFTDTTTETLQYSLSADLLYAGLEGAVTFIQSAALLVTVLAGGVLVAQKSLSLGELTSFILYAGMTSGAATALGALWGEWMRAIGGTDRVFELLVEAGTENASEDARSCPSLHQELHFSAVSFTYPTRPEQAALKQFCLRIEPGEKIALVGASGAGKSTVINLLLGFYAPTQGEIRIGDRNMQSVNLRELRQQVALVEQEPALFSCSILDNIRYGALSDVDEQQILRAAKDANIHEFVNQFPAGYQTGVGARGVQLSGGQKQRVAIARALIRNPKLLILDEATSALDADSEQKLQQALQRVMEGRTTIIIAHRLSTITFADRIVVMRDGCIVQIGTHQELIKNREGHYYQLIAGQMAACADGSDSTNLAIAESLHD
ncbi:ABC transporter ATP-binding protein [Permianibacter aggregans]|uniref:ATP-binding cassette subfamily B protein n=1 Tax=Permianibacter aggregans TaxID=1510150 RepID=A0A4R6USC7_9GAMM|nr:ABC transporter ATP-binding protein [Permianibacter aggregans]TDQ46254.1 ATP-binding cassette subfamily B protein [Permianibacter aggregans]